MNSILKKIAFITTTLAMTAASACWYSKSNYNDYVATINNAIRHASEVKVVQGNASSIKSIEYTIANNLVVDFPVTVTMKITSEQPIQMVDAFDSSSTPRASNLEAMLQYRILPDGDWITVSNFSIETGRLPESYPPAPYLGRNNIWPKGLKKGDKIMVRLYVTDGQWQSGDISSKCNARTSDNSKYRYEFSQYKYKVTNVVTDEIGESDLGDGWLPHYVVVLEYSGNTRPIQ